MGNDDARKPDSARRAPSCSEGFLPLATRVVSAADWA